MFTPALVMAALIGLSLGLLGSGGSIVTLPVLVYVAKVPRNKPWACRWSSWVARARWARC